MKRFGLFNILIIIFSISILNAGSFENFKHSQFSNFQEYKDEKDTEFSSYLKSQWKVYQEQQSLSIYEKPKPKKLPSSKIQQIKKIGPKVNIKIKDIKEFKKSDDYKILDKKNISFDFFGTLLEFNVPNDIKRANFFPRNQKGVINFFEIVASSDHEQLIKNIKNIKTDLNLNDWGVYLLVLKLSKKIYTELDNAKLFTWFVFNKLGYAVKVAIANKHVVVLHYSKKNIYSTPNYNFSNKKFYVLSHYNKENIGRLYTYSKNYPGSNKPIDLSLKSLPDFVKNEQNKKLEFIYNEKNIEIKFSYNKNLIDFMSTYPQADYETYFNAPLEKDTYVQIAKELKKHLDGKKISEAINFVLHFVQKSFKYEVDSEQFGHEKVMFAQETLYYDRSDCEDRAVLFSYLIKNLFGISVLGVKYKDHIATALYIPMDGDSIKVGSKRFVIADPTYVNANIGQSMPKYKSIIPDSFIVVN